MNIDFIIWVYVNHKTFKTDGAMLDIPTGDLQLEYIYKITVTESGITQTLQLNPSFIETDPIAW